MESNGLWWKFSRYELVNGVICPADGAILQEYDPWPVFHANERKRRTVTQPYVSLLELARQIRVLSEKRIHYSAPSYHPKCLDVPEVGARTEIDAIVLDWCNGNGLLGILPTLASLIRLPPELVTITPGLHFRIRQATCHRFHGGWFTLTDYEDHYQLTDESIEKKLQAELDKKAKQDPPGVHWYLWWLGSPKPKPPAYIQEFFPAVHKAESAASYQFPEPNSPAFWSQYGEPMPHFLEWCTNFVKALEFVSSGVRKLQKTEKEKREYDDSLLCLEGLTTAIGTTYPEDRGGRIYQERRSAGLLASYAQMFLLDVCADRRALRCEHCDRFFVSDEFRAKYCSPRCRNAFQVRRHRSRKEKVS